MIGSQYHWKRIVQKLERPGHWKYYLNFYFWLPRNKTGEALKIEKIARSSLYWEVRERESDLVFIHDNTMRESRDTVHWQVLKLGFLVGGKLKCWEMTMRTQNHKFSNSKPSAPRDVRRLHEKQSSVESQWSIQVKKWRKCSQ